MKTGQFVNEREKPDGQAPASRPGKDPMDGHKCKEIARVHNMGENREMWLGKLLEPIPGEPQETHCMHIKTPYKEVVWGILAEDLASYVVFDYILRGHQINFRWLQNVAEKYQQ